jgi:hypothetical protein
MSPNHGDEHQKYVEGREIRRLEAIPHYVSTNRIEANIKWTLERFSAAETL